MLVAVRRFRFGTFELDLHDRELRKNGLRVKLQEQPFHLLELLLERPGELVTRIDLARHLWPDLHVNFERSLNTAVNALRLALGDSSRSPRFIETRAGLGYRFIAKVEALREPDGTAARETVNSIAVLPFEYVGNGTGMDYLTDGIAESIIRGLSAVENLRVIARGTAFRFRGPDVEPRAVGRLLNVGTVLSGRVEQSGEEVTIGVDLIDVHTGSELWGERYSRPRAEVFAIEKDISSAVSKRLGLPAESRNARSAKVATGSLEAHQNYLKGRYFYDKLREDDLHKSIAYFEAALAIDPQYALAYAGLADSYLLFAFLGVIPAREAHARANECAATALRIDDGLAEAHASLATVKKLSQWDWAGAEVEYLRAMELNPNYAAAHRSYADYLSAMGRHDQAIREIRRAQELDPLSLVVHMELAWDLYMARDFQASMEQSWRTLALEPKFAPAQHTLGLAYEQMGLYEEAIVELQNARVCSEDHPATLAALGHAYATAGAQGDARAVLAELEAMAQRRHVSPYGLSLVHAALGDREAAFDALRRAHAERDVWLVWLNVEPRFDHLRSDTRLDELIRSIGLRAARAHALV